MQNDRDTALLRSSSGSRRPSRDDTPETPSEPCRAVLPCTTRPKRRPICAACPSVLKGAFPEEHRPLHPAGDGAPCHRTVAGTPNRHCEAGRQGCQEDQPRAGSALLPTIAERRLGSTEPGATDVAGPRMQAEVRCPPCTGPAGPPTGRVPAYKSRKLTSAGIASRPFG